MGVYVEPEIQDYSRTIAKSALGSMTEIRSFRWADGGGLYNKVFCLDTSAGSFILKTECDRIFPSTRKNQIENEVEGSRLLKLAGVPCPMVTAYDFTGREAGVRYVLTECLSDDWPVIARMDQMDIDTVSKLKRQAKAILVKISTLKNTHFGGLFPSSVIGWHKTWGECYRAWFKLLISDCVSIGLFTDEELAIVKAAAASPGAPSSLNAAASSGAPSSLNAAASTGDIAPLCDPCNPSPGVPAHDAPSPDAPAPVFSTEDMGWHNMIWGHTGDTPDALHVIDFGNSRYVLPYMNDYLINNIDAMGIPPFRIPEYKDLDRGFNLLLLYDFEAMLWKEAEKRIEDYAHIRDWMAAGVEKSKKDASRSHITSFVDECLQLN